MAAMVLRLYYTAVQHQARGYREIDKSHFTLGSLLEFQDKIKERESEKENWVGLSI